MRNVPVEVVLARAILRESCPTDIAAAQVLAAARAAGVDPLDYFSHHYGLGSAAVAELVARWIGCQFVRRIPSVPEGASAFLRSLTDLGSARRVRAKLDSGDEMLLVAPTFDDVLTLGRYCRERPDIASRLVIAPQREIQRLLAGICEPKLLDYAVGNIRRLWPHASAGKSLTRRRTIVFAAALAISAAWVLWASAIGAWHVLPIAALLLLIPGLARLVAALPRTDAQGAEAPTLLEDAELPVYTVLVPLRDESHMVPQLIRAMRQLDYPPEKLDIRFVVESTSPTTVAAIEAALDDPRFSLVVVPDQQPRTKPKALDYALPTARGEFVVVYDAEDVPEPDQLRIAASRFATDPDLACLQAELVADNAGENWLTALFAGEYAGLFGQLLPALARWDLPIPLGGTSNHFRISMLRRLGGWDAFNVTEDADLGVRLARRHMRTATIASRTYEEAPITLRAWMAQRTRWCKGWMQTLIVHNRAPRELLAELGWRRLIAFELMVGSMVLSSLLHTLFLMSLAPGLLLYGLSALLPDGVGGWAALAILLVGYGGAFALVVSGLARLGKPRLLLVQVLLPVYWILHSVAAVRAVVDLLRRPHFWAKTQHGLTSLRRADGSAPLRAPAFEEAPAQAE